MKTAYFSSLFWMLSFYPSRNDVSRILSYGSWLLSANNYSHSVSRLQRVGWLLWLIISLSCGLENELWAQGPTAGSLELTKLVNKPIANRGDQLTYTLIVANNGSSAASNIIVRDSSDIGLRYLTDSATPPTGTTFIHGASTSTWTVATLSAGQSLTLTFQAVADSSGILYNRATIPGDTAVACTSIPVHVCTGDQYTFRLTAAPGRSSYRWFKNDVEIASQTTNVLDVTTPGSYSLAVDNISGHCPDFTCCSFVVVEDALPAYQARAVAANCAALPQATGQIVLSDFNGTNTYQYSVGTTFNAAASLSGTPKVIPANGVLINNLPNPASSTSYTIRVYNGADCYIDQTVTLLPAACCSLSATATAGLCALATNTYSSTVLVTLTNPAAGLLTVTDGVLSLTTAVSSTTGNVTYPATFTGIQSDGNDHTVTVSLPGCGTISRHYTAPISCTVGLALSVTDPGTCQPATNRYTTTGTISLTNAIAGTALVTDGTLTTTLSITAGQTSATYSLTGLLSGTGRHTVTVAYANKTASTTYTAPLSCSVASCGLAMVVTPGLCQSATNTYTLSGTLTASNAPSSGTITVISASLPTQSLSLPSGNSSNAFSYSGLISNGQTYTLTASYSNSACSPVSQTFAAPTSCSVAPVCSVSATAKAVQVTCAGNIPQANGQLIVSNFTAGSTYQYALGTTYNENTLLSGPAQPIPAGGVLTNNLTNPVGTQPYTIRIYNGPTCYLDVTVSLIPAACICPPSRCVPLLIRRTR